MPNHDPMPHTQARKRHSALQVLLLAAFVLLAPSVAGGQTARSEIAGRIDALLANPALKGGIQGIAIRSLRDGATWYERNVDLLFMPASNQKLVTSAAALAILGPGWRYTTRLVRTAPVGADGVLRGDLVLVGSGDPTIDHTDLDALVAAARRAGIRRIAGRVLGDDHLFDTQRYGDGWSWGYLSDYYAAEVGALTMDRGVVAVKVEHGPAAGDLVRVSLTPPEAPQTVVVRAATTAAGSKADLTVERELGRDTIRVTGTLPLEGTSVTVPTTVDRPARHVAAVLAARLRRAGIGVGGGSDEVREVPAGAVEIARHTSDTLASILVKLNKPSDNLIAECLLKTLGAQKGGGGTSDEGGRIVTEWLKSAGVDASGVSIADGSGLSRMNGISPRALVGVLQVMHNHKDRGVFVDSLPIAGVDGSLRNRMKNTRAANNCRAKTGYVGWVSSLSGYVTTRSGEPLAFVILMNNHRCPNSTATGIQNSIVEMLAD